jgi:hypothetical protein
VDVIRFLGLGGLFKITGNLVILASHIVNAGEAPVASMLIALRHCPGEDLDLAVVQAEAPIDRGNLRLDLNIVPISAHRL